MGIPDDVFKNLGEEMAVSYDERVKIIGELASDVHRLLKEFHLDHEEMAANLRVDLGKGEEERLKDFGELDADLKKGEKERLKDFKTMMSDVYKFIDELTSETAKLLEQIRGEQKERNTEVANLLVGFKKEHEAMARELKKNLAAAEKVRLEDFEEMIKSVQKYINDLVAETKRLISEIQVRQVERKKEVLDLLEEFKIEREKMAANWQEIVTVMAKKRGVKPVVSAAAEVKTVEEAVEAKSKGGSGEEEKSEADEE